MHRPCLIVALVSALAVLAPAFCRSASTAGFVGTFSMQPVGSSIEALAETSLTSFTGTLYITVRPQTWTLVFDDIAPGNTELISVRRWATTEVFAKTGFEIDFNAEMTFYREQNTTNAVSDCCSQTPLYDRFTLPNVNQPFGITYAGRPVVMLVTSQLPEGQNAINLMLNDSITMWEHQTADNDETTDGVQSYCPLECNAPVDVAFNMDASSSVYFREIEKFYLLKNFTKSFLDRFLFTPDFNSARASFGQFGGYCGENNNAIIGNWSNSAPNRPGGFTNMSMTSNNTRYCYMNSTEAINDPFSTNQSMWGFDYRQLDTQEQYKNFFRDFCYDSDELDGVNDRDPYNSNSTGWYLIEAFLSGNKDYVDFSLQRWSAIVPDPNGNDSKTRLRNPWCTGIGTGLYFTAKELERGHRGKQQILVTLSDGGESAGVNVAGALPAAVSMLSALDGPLPQFVAVGIDGAKSAQLLAAANNNPQNILPRVNNGTVSFGELTTLTDRLVFLSCVAEYDKCQGTCNGICSPCGDCLCPTCPNLECQPSRGCVSGICQYADRAEGCCPAKFVEACDRRGGVLDDQCACTSGDGDDTFVVIAASVGSLVGVAVLAGLALLLVLFGLAALVTLIILVLKAQAIAAAISSLGVNAFGIGGNYDNPSYSGTPLGGDNPLFAGDL